MAMYSSKLDDSNDSVVTQNSIAIQPARSSYLPTVQKELTIDNVDGLLQQKFEAQEAMAYATYHRRMANAGVSLDSKGNPLLESGDSTLAAYAMAGLQNDISDLRLWQSSLKNKMKLIASEETFTSDEKNLLMNKVLSKTKDAIYIPNMSESGMSKGQSPFTQSYIQQNIGELAAAVDRGDIADLTTALKGGLGITGDKVKGVVERFGPDWQKNAPEVVEVLKPLMETNKAPSAKQKIGDIIARGGKQWKITGFDTDGTPLVDKVK